MVNQDRTYARHEPDRELNVREAKQWRLRLLEVHPQLDVEVWSIAQGLAFLRVDGPMPIGVVHKVCKTPRDVMKLMGVDR